MTEILQLFDAGTGAATVAILAIIYYRITRLEKDAEKLHARVERYEAKVDKIAGKIELMTH